MLRLIEERPIVTYEGESYAVFNACIDEPGSKRNLDWWRTQDILPSGYEFYRENRRQEAKVYLCVGRKYDRFRDPFPDELHVLSVALQVIKNYEERNNVTGEKSSAVCE